MVILCMSSLSLSFSYFIERSTITEQPIQTKDSDIELTYEGESIIAPNEEKELILNIKNNKNYVIFFKIYHKNNLNIIRKENIPSILKSHEEIKIKVHIKNESDKFKQINVGIKTANAIDEFTLNDGELWL